MVLDHVAQCAGRIIVRRAPFDTDRLGSSDLHALNEVGRPYGFNDRVCEAQPDDVLDGFFAQIVIDAANVVFWEILPDAIVDGFCRRTVRTNRLLEHGPRERGDQVFGVQIFTDRTVQLWSSREIIDADALWRRG